MTPSDKKLAGALMLIAITFVVPLLFLVTADSSLYGLGFLPFEFWIGIAVGWFTRSTGLRLAYCFSAAVVGSRPWNFVAETGEERGWAMMVFPYLFGFGVVACGTGVLLGHATRWLMKNKQGEITSGKAVGHE